MSVLQEFKTFALKGNVLDLAVFLIVKAANRARPTSTT
jgi:large-conductance mechanosensitive channel